MRSMSKNNLKKLFCFSTFISLCSGIFGAPIAKFTFIPVPFAAVSNGKFMGGAMVMNMNAFGNKTMQWS